VAPLRLPPAQRPPPLPVPPPLAPDERLARPEPLLVATPPQAGPEPEPDADPAPPPPLQLVPVAPLRTPPAQRPPPLPVPPPLAPGERLARPEPLLVATPPPAQAAQLLSGQLRAAPPAQWPGLLAASRRTPGWENLDFQAALEQAVLALLLRQFDSLQPQVEAFAKHYGWKANQVHTRHGESQVDTLLARNKARQRLQQLQYSARHGDARRMRALELLLGAQDEPRFRRFARRGANLRSMKALLAQLQSQDTELLRHELDRDSTRWWNDHLAGAPLPLDQAVQRVVLGILTGPLLLGLLTASIKEFAEGFNLVNHPWLALPLLLLLMGLPLGLGLARRAWRRRGMLARLLQLRERWRHEPRPRRVFQALTALVLLLSAGAGSIPGFGVFPLLAVGLLWFWTRLGFAVASAAVLAWPLQLPLSLMFSRLSELWPALARHADTSTLAVWYPHWLAMYLVLPFNNACAAVYARLFRQPRADGLRLGFFTSLALAFALFIAAGLAGWLDSGTTPAPPVPPRRPIQAGPPSPRTPAAPPAAPRPSPPPAVVSPRSDAQIQQTYRHYAAQFHKLFVTYVHPRPGQAPKTIVIELQVAPSGEVRQARLLESGYHSPEFEDRMLALAMSQKFDPLPGGAEQRIVYTWGRPAAAP
jgi:hypothetical protein